MTNEFKRKLKTGDLQIGLWASFGDSYATEITASAGFDWLLLDAEHGPNDLISVLHQLQAIAGYATEPVVRLPCADAVLIKQYLDVGAQSLMIPMIETAEEARRMVNAARYPPGGMRGVATGRASRWGAETGYMQSAADLVCVVLQIESRTGLENLDAIAEVEGVDGIFFGPSDLAAGLGRLGDPGHTEVVEIINQAIARVRQAGKSPGILTADALLAQRYIEAGVSFCAVGVDTLMLAQAARSLARRFKPDLDADRIAKPVAAY